MVEGPGTKQLGTKDTERIMSIVIAVVYKVRVEGRKHASRMEMRSQEEHNDVTIETIIVHYVHSTAYLRSQTRCVLSITTFTLAKICNLPGCSTSASPGVHWFSEEITCVVPIVSIGLLDSEQEAKEQ